MNRARTNYRKPQPQQKERGESPQKVIEVDNLLTNLHGKLHSLENKYGDFVSYCANVLRDNKTTLERKLYQTNFVDEQSGDAIEIYDDLQEERRKLEEDLNYVLTVKDELGLTFKDTSLMDTNGFAPISEALSNAQEQALVLTEPFDSMNANNGLVEIFTNLSGTIWNALLSQREDKSDTLNKIAKLENELEQGKIEANKRQILKVNKENALLRETISELNEQINLLHEKMLSQDDIGTQQLVDQLKEKMLENDMQKSNLKKASDSIKSLQKKLAEATTAILTKDQDIHKRERAYKNLKADMELMNKTLNTKISQMEIESKTKRRTRAISVQKTQAAPVIQKPSTPTAMNRYQYLLRGNTTLKSFSPVKREFTSPVGSRSPLNSTFSEVKSLRLKLQQASKERDYYKSFAKKPSEDSRLLSTQLSTLIELADPIVTEQKIDFNETKRNLKRFLEEVGTDKFSKSVGMLEDEIQQLERNLADEREKSDKFCDALELKNQELKRMKQQSLVTFSADEPNLREKYSLLKKKNQSLEETVSRLNMKSPRFNHTDSLEKLQTDLNELGHMLILKNKKYKKLKQEQESEKQNAQAICEAEISKYAAIVDSRLEAIRGQLADKEAQLAHLKYLLQQKLEEELRKLEDMNREQVQKSDINDAFIDIETQSSEIQELRDEIRKLNEEVDNASIKSNQYQFEINQLEYENQTLEDQSKVNQEMCQELEKQRLELESEFTNKLNEANSKIEDLVYENSTLKQGSELEDENSRVRNELSKLSEEKEQLIQIRDELGVQLGDEVIAKNRANQKKEKLDKNVADLTKKVEELKGYQQDAIKLEAVILELKQSAPSSSELTQISDLTTQLARTEDIVEQLRLELKDSQATMENENNQMKTKLNELSGQYEALQEIHIAKKNNLKTQLAEVQGQLQEDESNALDRERLQELEQQVPKLRAKKAAVQAKLVEVQKKPQEDQNFQAAQERLEKLEQQVPKLRAQKSALKSLLVEVQKKSQDNQTTLLAQELQKLNKEVTKLRAKKTEFKEILEEAQRKSQEDQNSAQEKLEKQLEEISKLKEKEAELVAQLVDVQKAPQEDQNASQAQEKLGKLEEELAKLRENESELEQKLSEKQKQTQEYITASEEKISQLSQAETELKAELEATIRKSQQESKTAQEKIQKLESEVPKLRASYAALKAKLAEVKAQPREELKDYSDSEALSKLQQDVLDEKRQKEEAILETSRLKYEIDEMCGQIIELGWELDIPPDTKQVLIALREVVEEYKNLQKANENLTKRSSEESQASAQEAEEMRGEISAQEEELNVVHSTNKSLMEQLKTTTAGTSALNETCQALELDLVQAETDVKILQKEKQILVQRVATMESDMSNLLNEKNSAKASLTELRDMVESIQMETNDQLSNHKNEVAEERKLGESYLEQKQAVEEELWELQKKLEEMPELEKQISREQQRNFHLQSTIETMEDNETELKHTLKMKNTIIQQFKAEQSDTESGRDPKHRVEELITKIAQLEAELESASDSHADQEKALSSEIEVLSEANEDLMSKMENQKESIVELETKCVRLDFEMKQAEQNRLKASKSKSNKYGTQIPESFTVLTKILVEEVAWALVSSEDVHSWFRENDLLQAGHIIPDVQFQDPVIAEIRSALGIQENENIIEVLTSLIDPNYETGSVSESGTFSNNSETASNMLSGTQKLHRLIRTLKQEVEEGQSTNNLLQEQIRVLKTELMSQHESSKEPVATQETTLESLKDLMLKFVIFLPLTIPKEADNLLRVVYSMLNLTTEEIDQMEGQRKEFNSTKGKKKKWGFFGGKK